MNKILKRVYSSYEANGFVRQLFKGGYFCRPFDKKRKKLLLLYYPSNGVAFSQIYPFFYYDAEIAQKYDISIRALPVNCLNDKLLRQADVIGVQTEFSLEPYQVSLVFEHIRQNNSRASLFYLDWFSPADLRMAEPVNGYVDLYVKRHLLQDLNAYNEPILGDTNLMDYFSRYYNLGAEERRFHIPKGFFEKIIMGPGLFTGPSLFNGFARNKDFSKEKTIDVHARFSCRGTPWYSAMRSEARLEIERLKTLRVVSGSGVSQALYVDELARSKTCFSPFGYGEVCWRDYKAILSNALLLKPNMSHLRIEPNIYIENEAYVPLSWDFSDLEEKLYFYLNDSVERARIVKCAREILMDYFVNEGFLKQMAPVFQLAQGQKPELSKQHKRWLNRMDVSPNMVRRVAKIKPGRHLRLVIK